MATINENPSTNGSSQKSNEGFGARVDHLGQNAQKLYTDAKDTVSELTSSLDLTGRVQRNPYGMMAAALGIGYVLGGGLFTPLTARILRLGFRLAAIPLVKEELVGMAEGALDSFSNVSSGRRGGGGVQS